MRPSRADDGSPGGGASTGARARVAVLLATVAVFVTALDNGFVNWDDGIYIVRNPLVLDPGSAGWIERLTTPALGYPIPLPVAVYGALWSLSEEPFLFHAFSLVVHVGNVWLLTRVLDGAGVSVRTRSLAAMAFAVHPIVVEPVVWATGLKDLLVGTGVGLAVLGWQRRRWWALVGVAVALASKPNAVLLAAVLGAMTLGRWREASGRDRTRELVVVGAAAAMGAALLWFTVTQETPELQTSRAGPPDPRDVLGALGLHLEHLLSPAALSPRYPRSAVGWPHLVLGAAGWLVMGVALVSWTRRRDARLPWLVLALATYLPASNVRPLIRFTADSYLYVPWMALVGTLASSVSQWWPRLEAAAGRTAVALRRLPTVLVVAWGVLSALQANVWQDTETLWRRAHERYPDDGELIYLYGDALGRADKENAELDLYLDRLDALAESPKIPVLLVAWYGRRGEVEEAERWFARAWASDVKQDDGLYAYYCEYLAAHPDRPHAVHGPALAHSLTVYVERLDSTDASAQELLYLSGLARQLGANAIAARIERHAREGVVGSSPR